MSSAALGRILRSCFVRTWRLVRSIRYVFSSPRGVFTHIYRTNRWGDPVSISGPGSNPENTAAILAAIPGILERYDVASILDIPCGDYAWMRHLPFDGRYIGADVVPDIITRNRELYAAPSRRFEVLDLLVDALPRVDLILCRDCMVHLSNGQVRRGIARILASRSRLLLATHFPNCRRNKDIITGSWRPINLEIAPFRLPPPILMIDEPKSLHQGKTLSLWKLDDCLEKMRDVR